MAITAKKIAEKLNLSPSAVSLALNGKPGVSDSTRELVLAEAERMGYAKQKVTTAGPQNIRFVIFLGHQRIIQKQPFIPTFCRELKNMPNDMVTTYW